jgi:hypothetical protein
VIKKGRRRDVDRDQLFQLGRPVLQQATAERYAGVVHQHRDGGIAVKPGFDLRDIGMDG